MIVVSVIPLAPEYRAPIGGFEMFLLSVTDGIVYQSGSLGTLDPDDPIVDLSTAAIPQTNMIVIMCAFTPHYPTSTSNKVGYHC